MFDPEPAYTVVPENLQISEFTEYWEDYVVRPPYQRKTVWSRAKQQALLDSIFRGYYVPRIVIREVRLSDRQVRREVVDGQQRISTAKAFRDDDLPLPNSLEDLDTSLPGKRFSELSSEIRRFVNRMSFTADVIKGISDPLDSHHQEIASEIFWRLQQGVPLNFMETAHARLASLARNFIVRHADDISFDFDRYEPLESNPDKHPFFSVINRKNDRMQHLALLARFLLLEKAGGPADIQDKDVSELIEETQQADGVGSQAYEEDAAARSTLKTMRAFYEVFKDDTFVRQGEPMKELGVEYFIISIYLLLRHLREQYVFADGEKTLFHDFVLDFHQRWSDHREDDSDVLRFSDARQQSAREIEVRHRVLRQLFFEFAQAQDHPIIDKDTRRAFDEAERIAIYRRDDGLCQMCLEEDKPEQEARVPWREFDADHVRPHSRGGRTVVENGRVLCRTHNRGRGVEDSTPSPQVAS